MNTITTGNSKVLGPLQSWTLNWTGPWTGLWTGPCRPIHSYSDSNQLISLYHCLADLHSFLIQDIPHLNNIYDKHLMKSFHEADASDVLDQFYLTIDIIHSVLYL